ncbi:unnamed protein product, partial [Thlaspi arvense]
GTNWQLSSLQSFNMRINCGASCYYITLAACVPDTGLHQSFHVLVQERRIGILDLKVSIARPLGIYVTLTTKCPKKDPLLRPHCNGMYDYDLAKWPEWPSSEIAFSDRKRFHLVKESELGSNDWITLYLELSLVSHDRSITDLYLSQLEIVQVAIETIKDWNESLDAKTATVVYIWYKDFAKALLGEPLDRKAVVRRVMNERSGLLTLVGDYWRGEEALSTTNKTLVGESLSGEEALSTNETLVQESLSGENALSSNKISKKQSAKLRRRLGVHRLYKNRGLRSR